MPTTTWNDLLELGWVTKMAGGPPPFYRLTGRGWYEGLILNEQLDEIRVAADAFMKAVKARVNRDEDKIACIHDFGAQKIAPGFIFNAVDSNLLARLYGEHRGYGLRWSDHDDPYNDSAPFFVIPCTFGLPPLRP